jgi:transglutaminase-like putative cysteine protease
VIKPAPARIERRLDYFGNQVAFFNVQEGHHKLTVTAMSRVQVTPFQPPAAAVTPTWEQVRDRLMAERMPAGLEDLQFLYDSPAVTSSAELAAYAVESFPPNRPWLEGVFDLTRRIHRDFVYDPRATTINTPLAEVLSQRRGVCQDFAHLAIGCLRSLGLPARYVSGYLQTVPPPGQPRMVGADASHAWLSVWCPETGWIDIDPTNDQVPSTRHVTLAWGRDYTDVCPIRGVFLGGGGEHHISVSVDVQPLRGDERE